MSFFKTLVADYADGADLPARLEKFFGTGEYQKFHGKFVSNLPNYSSDSRLALDFSEDSLQDLFEDFVDNDLANEEDRDQFIPFASIGDSQYLAVKVTDGACPIYMWEHEDGEFYEHSASLDEFLRSLHDEGNSDDAADDGIDEDESADDEEWTTRTFEVAEGVSIGSGKSAGVGKPGEVPANYHPDRDNPISAYRNVAGCSKEERWDYMMFIDKWNWEKYDYTTWPCADMTFPDLDEDKKYDLWPFKFDLSKPHWVDLNNQYKTGVERRVVIEGNWEDYKIPEQYVGKDAQKLLEQFEALIKNGDAKKIQAAGFKNADHIKYQVAYYKKEIAKANAAADEVLGETKAMLDKQMNANIDSAKKGGLLDAVRGISMEDWAAANAKMVNGMALADVLKVLSIEKPVWDEVSAEWNARMSRDTTGAITTTYGNAFVNSNIGKFASADGNAGGGNAAVEKVKNDFDLYVKIMCHQSMGAMHGLDATGVLKLYGLTAADWGMLGAHWTPKMMSTEMAMKMQSLMAKYNAEFAAGAPAKAGDGIDF